MSSPDEPIKKSAPEDQSELAMRSSVRALANEKYRDQDVHLARETIGIACQLAGTEDPAAALQEIVADALTRWARLKVLDRMAHQLSSGAEPDRLTKRAPARTRSEE